MNEQSVLSGTVKSSWTREDVRHLLGRISFWIDEDQVETFSELSCTEAVDRILHEAQTAPLPAKPEWVKDPWKNTERRYQDTTSREFSQMHGMTNRRYASEIADLRRWWFQEMLTTPVPLREVLTLFWHGHFTSSIDKVLVSQAMYHQNAAQRQFALGNFHEFLKAMTLDPAMMIYLDLEESDGRQPNENYAREFYELFALGHGQYSQKDIMETARALSGWTLDAPPGTELPQRETAPGTHRRFTRDGLIPRLVDERHDHREKTILGKKGNFGVDEVIDLAVNRPACGLFLAQKLLTYFAVHDPHQRVRNSMAAAFSRSNGELAPMLRVLFTSPEFYAPESRECRIKSPIMLLVGVCGQLQLDVKFTRGMNRYLAALGQELFHPPNVKGWPGGELWIGAGTLSLRYHLAEIALESRTPPGMDPIGRRRGRPIPLPKDPAERKAFLERMSGRRSRNRPLSLAGKSAPTMVKEKMSMPGRRRGSTEPDFQVTFSLDRLFPSGLPESNEQLVDSLLSRLLHIPVRPELRTVAQEAAANSQGVDRVKSVVRLVLASPDYQLS